MTKHVLLNNVAHKDLKVITRYSAEYGDNVSGVLTFPTEYGDIQREYPILFRKSSEANEFQSVALLGFEKNENLFLSGSNWNANYVPGIVARGPFLIGFQEQEINGEVISEPVIHIDMDDPRVSDAEGEPVFLTHGGNSPYLEKIASILKGIRDGLEVSKTMFIIFGELGLIEPVAIEIGLNREEKFTLNGYYTISEEKLAALNGQDLEKLNKMGLLQSAFLVIASLHNVKKLIVMKNQRKTVGHKP